MNEIERPRLYALLDTDQHVMLCGPLGYGKSVLLRQYTAVRQNTRMVSARRNSKDVNTLLGAVLPGATTLDDLAAAGVTTLIIDSAHLAPAALIETLLQQAQAQDDLRLIIAVRHSSYAGFQPMLRRNTIRVLTNTQLAFTRDEAAHATRGLDTYAAHLGWPVVVSGQESAHFELNEFLQDAVMDLPGNFQETLKEAVRSNNLPGLLLDWKIAGHLPGIANLGFPLIEQAGSLIVHPILTEHLAGHEAPAAITRGVSEALRSHLQLVRNTDNLTQRKMIVESYFAAHGEDEPSIQARIELLESVPRNEMSARQRDRLARFLISVGRMNDAQLLLDVQRGRHAETGQTYFSLARVANYRNELPAMKDFLKTARSLVTGDAELSKILGMESLLETRLSGGDLTRALALAEERHSVASRSGLLYEELASYWNIANAHQYLGNLQGAANAAQAGLERARNHPHQDNIMLDLLVILSDTLKSLGRHDEALESIQESLTFNENDAETAYSGVPYAYFTRGLVYLELGQNHDAVASFQVATQHFGLRENLAGVLLPLSFQAYAEWRLGWTESLLKTHTALTHVTKKIRIKAEYVEWQAYVPLVEGLYHLSRHEPQWALEELRKTRIEGHEMYDSVLLSVLLMLQIQLKGGVFNPQDAAVLLRLLDFTTAPDDITLVAYADDFEDVVRAMIDHGPQPERFRKVLAHPRPKAGAKPHYHVTLQTMTPQPTISINGVRLPATNLYPVYTLAYLTYKHARNNAEWVSSDMLAQELYADHKGNAQSSVSYLRTALTQRDQEIEQDLLSAKNDRRGYRLTPKPHVTVEMDVFGYLSPAFSDANPDEETLWQMLRDIQPFLQTRKDPTRPVSPFILEVNKDLRKQAKAVARHLETQARQHGHERRAALALALYLRFDQNDYDLIHEIATLIPAGHPLRPHVTALNRDANDGQQLSLKLSQLIEALNAPVITPTRVPSHAAE